MLTTLVILSVSVPVPVHDVLTLLSIFCVLHYCIFLSEHSLLTDTRTHTQTHAHTHTHWHTHMQTHSLTRTHTDTHTHTQSNHDTHPVDSFYFLIPLTHVMLSWLDLWFFLIFNSERRHFSPIWIMNIFWIMKIIIWQLFSLVADKPKGKKKKRYSTAFQASP